MVEKVGLAWGMASAIQCLTSLGRILAALAIICVALGLCIRSDPHPVHL